MGNMLSNLHIAACGNTSLLGWVEVHETYKLRLPKAIATPKLIDE